MNHKKGGKRKGAGRPVGTIRGRKKPLTITVDPGHFEWLKKQTVSCSKSINDLIRKRISKEKPC